MKILRINFGFKVYTKKFSKTNRAYIEKHNSKNTINMLYKWNAFNIN